MGAFYQRVLLWDTMLHTINGFLMAAISFSVIGYFYVKYRGRENSWLASRLIPFVHHKNDNTDSFGNPISLDSDVASDLSDPELKKYFEERRGK